MNIFVWPERKKEWRKRLFSLSIIKQRNMTNDFYEHTKIVTRLTKATVFAKSQGFCFIHAIIQVIRKTLFLPWSLYQAIAKSAAYFSNSTFASSSLFFVFWCTKGKKIIAPLGHHIFESYYFFLPLSPYPNNAKYLRSFFFHFVRFVVFAIFCCLRRSVDYFRFQISFCNMARIERTQWGEAKASFLPALGKFSNYIKRRVKCQQTRKEWENTH